MKTKRTCPGCFQLLDDPLPCSFCGYGSNRQRPAWALPVSARVKDRYIIGNVLGQPGGFGITYLARDSRLLTIVALKEYYPDGIAFRNAGALQVEPKTDALRTDFKQGLVDFLQEARTVARISHPNVVRVRDQIEENGTAYMVMDYYEGTTLEHMLSRGSGHIEERESVTLGLALLDGLEAIHQAKVLHRDLKPANIFLAQKDLRPVHPIILDFGASRLAIGQRKQRLDQTVTPGYAPYEQYLGDGLNASTDLYALAAILYRTVTGTVPPEAPRRYKHDTLRPPNELNPSLSDSFSEAILKGLAVEQDARPQSVAEFRSMLQNPSNTKPAMAKIPPFPKEGWKKWSIMILGMILAIIAVAYLLPWLPIPSPISPTNGNRPGQSENGDTLVPPEVPEEAFVTTMDDCMLPPHPGRFRIAVGEKHYYNVSYNNNTHYKDDSFSELYSTLAEVCQALDNKHTEFFDQIDSHEILKKDTPNGPLLELKLTIVKQRTRPL